MMSSFNNHQRRRKGQHNHKELYGKENNNVDITEGSIRNDARIIQFMREIKELKEKVELQTELNRQLEKDKNELQSQLDSYKKRCSDLQKNLDDKDNHLNEVVATLTAQHSVKLLILSFYLPFSPQLSSLFISITRKYSHPSH